MNQAPFGKGSIVLTRTNWVGRVNWIYENGQVGITYLEQPNCHNVLPMEELTLLCQGAMKPMFDQVTLEKVERERKEYFEALSNYKGTVKRLRMRSKKEKTFEELIAEKLMSSKNKDEILKLLE